MAPSFDTLAYARRLREAGLTEQQAEGHAEALAAAMTDTLATKQDLRELEARMDARLAQFDSRFDELAARFDAKLAEQSQQLTMRMLLAVGAVSALVKIL